MGPPASADRRRLLVALALLFLFNVLPVVGHTGLAERLHLKWLGSPDPFFYGEWAILNLALIGLYRGSHRLWTLTLFLVVNASLLGLGGLHPSNPLFFGVWIGINVVIWRRLRRSPLVALAPVLLTCVYAIGMKIASFWQAPVPGSGGTLEFLLLVSTLLAGGWVLRSSWAGGLPTVHRALLAPALWILWLLGVQLGAQTSSFPVMVAVGAIPVGGVAAYALRRGGYGLTRTPLFSAVDLLLMALIGLVYLATNGFDSSCHYPVTNTYLRGNVPAAALNDPRYPLVYHAVFDLAGAIFARSLRQGHVEFALDAVSLLSLVATVSGLQAVSRLLFRDRWAQQAARAFFVLGFGPVYLLPQLAEGVLYPLCHGATTQAFLDASLRRPMGINFAVFVFLLGGLLPRLGNREGQPKPIHPLLLLPAFFLLPQLSEELIGYAGFMVGAVALARGISWRWAAALIGVLLIGASQSPVLIASAGVETSMAAPTPALAWPPSLPCWYEPWSRSGLPLFSWEGLWTLTREYGPLFLGACVLGLRRPRARVLVGIVVVGLLVACGMRLDGWIKSDLDRFLFYGTASGFMLCAAFVEALAARARSAAGLRRVALLVGIVAVAVVTLAGPASYLLMRVADLNTSLRHRSEPGDPLALQEAFEVVGPREQVSTPSLRFAKELVAAGFLVSAPMNSNNIGEINDQTFSVYVQSPPRTPEWLAVRPDSPLAQGREVHARYVLTGVWVHSSRPTAYTVPPYEERGFEVVLVREDGR